MSVLVKNAADRDQVKHAGRKERDARANELADLKAVLATPQGRRVLWRFMGYCAPMADPTESRGDMTHQNIGRGNVGRFMYAECLEADEQATELAAREIRSAARRDRIEADAVRTAPQGQPTGAEE